QRWSVFTCPPHALQKVQSGKPRQPFVKDEALWFGGRRLQHGFGAEKRRHTETVRFEGECERIQQGGIVVHQGDGRARPRRDLGVHSSHSAATAPRPL